MTNDFRLNRYSRMMGDNPFPENQFKTYHPEFPDRFGSLEDARIHYLGSFHWYNLQHHPAASPC